MATGNHELSSRLYGKFHSEFWDGLSEDEHDFYSDILSSMPIVMTTANGVALCHATLPPDGDFTRFDLTKKKWKDVLWADYHQDKKEARYSSRPPRFVNDFNKSMAAFGTNLLIKGHNPFAPLKMYDNRCVTIQTNWHYIKQCGMHIVIIDLDKPVKNADDVRIVNINNLKL